jgi:hypothetical protein
MPDVDRSDDASDERTPQVRVTAAFLVFGAATVIALVWLLAQPILN